MPRDDLKLLGKRTINARNRQSLEKRIRLEMVRARLEEVHNLSEPAGSSPSRSSSSSSAMPPSSPSPCNSPPPQGSPASSHSSEVRSTSDNWEVVDGGEPSEHEGELGEACNPAQPAIDDVTYLTNFLSKWAQRGVSFKKVDELLAGLNVLFPQLTKCHKVLLKCPIQDEGFVNIGEGLFWYKGIAENLRERLTAEYLLAHDEIVVDINIDGLDLFKSSQISFWPILGCLKGQRTPFIIACYCGVGHPSDLEFFMQKFIQESNNLQDNGFEFANTPFPFKLDNFILDAPARALVKCCTGHCSKVACEKCTIVGVRKYNRTVFQSPVASERIGSFAGRWGSAVFVGVDDEGEPRTDESFARRDQPGHHNGTSPSERDLGIKMVSQFRLDLHRKETAEELHIRNQNQEAGIRQPRFRPNGKITAAAKTAIDNAIYDIAPSIPSDFNRRPRSLHYVHFLKSTEWRRMLLYDGIRILKGNIPRNTYKHFLLLHCGMYILSSPKLVKEEIMLEAAELMLNEFVTLSVEVFDASFPVYNVHSLTHLVDECRLHGEADSFSAYKFENYLGSIKRALRSTHHPLQQLRNRDRECKGWLLQKDRKGLDMGKVTLKSLRAADKKVEEQYCGDQYRKIVLLGFTLSPTVADSAFKTVDGDVCILSNIIHCAADGKIIVSGYLFEDQEDYYTYPIESSRLGILKVKNLQAAKKYWSFSVVEFLPLKDGDPSHLEVIPSKWIKDDLKLTCYYPPLEDESRAQRFAMTLQTPDPTTWRTFHIKYFNSHDKYNVASKKCNKAIDTGEDPSSATDTSKPRKRKRPAKFLESSSDSDTPVLSKKSKAAPVNDSPKAKDLQLKLRSLLNKDKNTKVVKNSASSTVTLQQSKVPSNSSPRQRTSSNETIPSKSPFPSQSIGKSFLSPGSKTTMLSYSSKGSGKNAEVVINDDDGNLTDATEKISTPESAPPSPSWEEKRRRRRDRPEDQVDYVPPSENRNHSSRSVKRNFNESFALDNKSSGRSMDLKKVWKPKTPVSESQPKSVPNVDMRVMLKMLQEISSKVDVLTMNQQRILANIAPEEEMLIRPHDLPPLPLRTNDDFMKFEDFLREETAFSRVCSYLVGKMQGRNDEADATRHLLGNRVLLSTNLQKGISWEGTYGLKIAFDNTLLQQVVYCALLKKFKKSDLSAATLAAKRWFNTASQRKDKDSVDKILTDKDSTLGEGIESDDGDQLGPGAA
ncbi:Nucleolar MIF4G domain-containing protein 1-like protein [Frankliniella fusca]|uniref:Nucleolar MIF4G domain-containing protein 1-like protein n=1 Tax=Frankliniella fusca TaxID=407009 RepID=A0AAE1HYS9_9NEOP|nr:Nucleolar MIF4G domain-containing protein 1-like protein [Frankliniella fusca]